MPLRSTSGSSAASCRGSTGLSRRPGTAFRKPSWRRCPSPSCRRCRDFLQAGKPQRSLLSRLCCGPVAGGSAAHPWAYDRWSDRDRCWRRFKVRSRLPMTLAPEGPVRFDRARQRAAAADHARSPTDSPGRFRPDWQAPIASHQPRPAPRPAIRRSRWAAPPCQPRPGYSSTSGALLLLMLLWCALPPAWRGNLPLQTRLAALLQVRGHRW